MNVNELIPALLPAILTQLLLQLHVMTLVINDDKLSKRRQILLVVLTLFFNNIVVSSYLFYRSKRQEEDDIGDNVYFRRGVLALLTLSFQIFLIQMGFTYGMDHAVIALPVLASILFVLIVAMEVLNSWKRPLWTIPIAILLFGLTLWLELLMMSSTIPVLTLLVFIGILNNIPDGFRAKSIVIIALSYLVFIFIKAVRLYEDINAEETTIYVFSTFVLATMFLLAFASLKQQVKQNRTLQNLVDQLNEQARTIEQMAAREERSRMAADIHDHVGHTLTTAIIQLEGLSKQLEDDTLLSSVELAKRQVKNGLDQIRVLVRGVDIDLRRPFHDNLNDLLMETRRTTGLIIHEDIEAKIDLIPIQQKVLLSSIKEFITNSVKHGGASEISVLITSHNGFLECTLSNNGTTDEDITYGFGLTQMDKVIQSIGGMMTVSSTKDLGFILYYKIPLGGE
jgi:signal transduction histidine kinase